MSVSSRTRATLDSSERMLKQWYPESVFGAFTDVDGTISFYLRVRALVETDSTVLDVGCGRGAAVGDSVRVRAELRDLKSYAGHAIGIDVDPRASENELVHEVRLIDAPSWPIDDGSIDVCVCDYVVEHLHDPDALFSECSRVIRPRGYLCVRTINRRSYTALAARLVPNRLHRRVLAGVQAGRAEEDVFPTRYRCNTRGQLSRALSRHGFSRHHVWGHDAEPAYLGFSPILYRLGVWHQRYAPRRFATTLIAFAQRDGD